MDRQKLICEYQEAIKAIYRENDLTSLRGFDKDKLYIVNGRQIFQWYFEVIKKCSLKNAGQFEYTKHFFDLMLCSDKLLYFTAHLFLYGPFINDPIKESYSFNGQTIYPYNLNIEGTRYDMFADIAAQMAYNYWDRIGDLVASFFSDSIAPRNVYFCTAIEAIPKKFHFGDNYQWLNEFKKKEYVELNKKRKQIVHYTNSNTDFSHKHLEAYDDKEAVQAIQDERKGLADFYKNHTELTRTGFEKTLLFLEEVNAILFPDMKYPPNN